MSPLLETLQSFSILNVFYYSKGGKSGEKKESDNTEL